MESKTELIVFDSWRHMQNVVNRYVGWDKMTLYEPFVTNHYFKKYNNICLDIDDPRKGESTYLGLKVDGKYVGFANIYLDDPDELWIGDFEILDKRKGYGSQFFKMIEQKYKYDHYILCYHGVAAKKFWESLGFEVDRGCVMVK